jgi:transposase InsO family protein
MPRSTNRFSVLETCTLGITSDMLHPLSIPDRTETTPVMPPTPPTIPTLESDPPPRIYVRSADLRHCTKVPLKLRSVDTGHPLAIDSLLDSGATGMFIDIELVKEQKLRTRPLSRAIPVYNIDGTPNEAGAIKEEVDLICTFGEHTERATFSVTSLGRVAVILGHTWLVEHNPEVDWRTGDVRMTRCPESCGTKPTGRNPLVEAIPDEKRELRETPKQHIPALFEEGDRTFVIFVEKGSETIAAGSTVSQQLAEKASEFAPIKSFEDLVPKPYQEFKDVFAKESFDQLPPRKPWDHAIELTPGAQPFSTKVYPMSPNEQKELDIFLEENLKSHRIRPSKSPMASPVFFVKKKDGNLRFVQDYRKLNDITIKNAYPLPLVPDIMNKIAAGKAKYFTKLDVRWGYNNVRIKDGDEWKAAFRTNRGLYEPLVMFFGLTNSPATFQTMMNDLFKELIDEGVVVVFMDDILIFTESLEEHRRIVRRVLEILQANNLYLKPEKCLFEQLEVEYLGLILSQGQVAMDPVKVAGVRDWPVPRNVTEVKSFLGFINFYRRFVDDFSHIAKPLNQLTKQDTQWSWEANGPEQAAFNKLKHLITSTPILVLPDQSKHFRLETDASAYATGAVLSQLCDDEKWRPVGFVSKSLSDAERNYAIHDKELLSVIRGLEEWRHILEGTKHKVEILNDHQNLTYFRTAQNLNRRQARWSLYLSRFDFELIHRPGRHSAKPDALSRRVDHKRGEEDNQNQILLAPDLFHVDANSTETGAQLVPGEGDNFLNRVRDCTDRDEKVVKALKELGNTGNLRGEEWSEEDGLVLYRNKVYVPLDSKLRHDIVKAHHDTPLAGHPGRWKTTELVSRSYWWPGMGRYIAKYVRACDSCNRTKTFPASPVGKLLPNRIPNHKWQVISVDLIMELPTSHGHNALLVVVDRLSKRTHVIPTTSDINSVGIARLFRDHVWKLHGLPEEVISDRGTQFVSQFMRELNTLLGIKVAASTAYHPQTDGQTERVNQEIEQYLRLFINQRQDDWFDWISLAEFAYNNRVHSSTQTTPFMLDNGQHPRLGVEPIRETQLEALEDFTTRMEAATNEARSALAKAADDMAHFYDLHRQTAPSYKLGDKVWLNAQNITTTRPMKKLDHKWLGPYTINKVVSRNAYGLELPASFGRTHPVFSVVLLRPYEEDPIHERHASPPPSPIVRDGALEYEVEKILDSRVFRGKLEYLVRWKGYGAADDQWLPADDASGAKRLITNFHKQNPEAPRRIAAAIYASLPFQAIQNFTETPNRTLFDWTKGRDPR